MTAMSVSSSASTQSAEKGWAGWTSHLDSRASPSSRSGTRRRRSGEGAEDGAVAALRDSGVATAVTDIGPSWVDAADEDGDGAEEAEAVPVLWPLVCRAGD